MGRNTPTSQRKSPRKKTPSKKKQAAQKEVVSTKSSSSAGPQPRVSTRSQVSLPPDKGPLFPDLQASSQTPVSLLKAIEYVGGKAVCPETEHKEAQAKQRQQAQLEAAALQVVQEQEQLLMDEELARNVEKAEIQRMETALADKKAALAITTKAAEATAAVVAAKAKAATKADAAAAKSAKTKAAEELLRSAGQSLGEERSDVFSRRDTELLRLQDENERLRKAPPSDSELFAKFLQFQRLHETGTSTRPSHQAPERPSQKYYGTDPSAQIPTFLHRKFENQHEKTSREMLDKPIKPMLKEYFLNGDQTATQALRTLVFDKPRNHHEARRLAQILDALAEVPEQSPALDLAEEIGWRSLVGVYLADNQRNPNLLTALEWRPVGRRVNTALLRTLLKDAEKINDFGSTSGGGGAKKV